MPRRIYRELGLQLRNKTPKCRVKAKQRLFTNRNELHQIIEAHGELTTIPTATHEPGTGSPTEFASMPKGAPRSSN